MRTLALLSVAILAACQTTDLPPELRAPTDHIRPIETQTGASADNLVRVAVEPQSEPKIQCEPERQRALLGTPRDREGFARCLLRTGEATRAVHVLEFIDSALKPYAEVLSGRRAADEITLNAMLADSPGVPELWNLLGREYERQGREAEAVEAYVRARALR